MQINANDSLAGVPILTIRAVLKRALNRTINDLPFFAHYLDVSEKKARQVVTELVEQGYLQVQQKRPKLWSVTLKGGGLANATAAKPIRRATADRVLSAFMERVHEVNRNDYYLFKVTRVVLFGSYLSDKEMLGDVDVAIDIKRKQEDWEEHQRLSRQRIAEAKDRGRVFEWWYAEDMWPENETMLFLKSRSRALSLYTWEIDREMIEATNHKTLYEETPAEVAQQQVGAE